MQVELSHPDLGVLELGCSPYVVVELQLGSPDVRVNQRLRALADGAFDNTKYLGPRGATLTLRLNNLGACSPGGAIDMQTLIDRAVPYMDPALRPLPELSWQLPGSPSLRKMAVSGRSWPFSLGGPKAPAWGLQWSCPSGEITAGGPDALQCVLITPSTDVETGRTYDLTFDRAYPPGAGPGDRIVDNPGNARTHWVLTIFGAVEEPSFVVNGITISFDQQGGLDLTGSQTVVIDTRAKTVLLNGETSVYQYTNYQDWDWADLRLVRGQNAVRYSGTDMSEASQAQLCFTPTFLG